MRDDIKKLHDGLLVLLRKKINYIKDIESREVNLSIFVSDGNIEKIDDVLSYDNSIIEIINALDFDIKNLQDKICKVSGVDMDEFNNFILNKEEFSEVNVAISSIKTELDNLYKKRSELVKRMESSLLNIKKDINGLNTIDRLKQYLQ